MKISKNNPKNKLWDFEPTIYEGSRKKKQRKKNKKQKYAVFCFEKYF